MQDLRPPPRSDAFFVPGPDKQLLNNALVQFRVNEEAFAETFGNPLLTAGPLATV
jgi:hypothetical protein